MSAYGQRRGSVKRPRVNAKFIRTLMVITERATTTSDDIANTAWSKNGRLQGRLVVKLERLKRVWNRERRLVWRRSTAKNWGSGLADKIVKLISTGVQ